MRMTSAASRILAVFLLAAVVAAGYFLVVEPVRVQFSRYEQEALHSRELLARYEAAFASAGRLRSEISALKSERNAAGPFLKGGQPQLVAAGLQERLRTLIEKEGGALKSIQVLPDRKVDGYERIGLRVSMVSDVSSMQAVLYAVETSVPYLFVDNLDVRTIMSRRSHGEEEPIELMQVRFDAFGYRRPEDAS